MTKLKIKMIDAFDIVPNCNKIRGVNEINNFSSLVESIRVYGILHPIIVRKISQGKTLCINGECIKSPKYEIISGERRWRSAKLLNIKKIPCLIYNSINEDNLLLSLNENIHREDLNIFEQAKLFHNLLNKFGLSIEDISEHIGLSKRKICSILDVLKLSNEEISIIISYNLTEGHIRELVRVDDADIRKKLLTKILASGLNVFETEELIDGIVNSSVHNDFETNHNDKSRILMVSDIRFFYNSIEKALSILRQTGISVEDNKIENENFIDIHIRICNNKKFNNG